MSDERVERVREAIFRTYALSKWSTVGVSWKHAHEHGGFPSKDLDGIDDYARAAVAAMDAEPCTRRDCVSQVESLEEQVRTLIQSNIAKERHIKTLLEGQPTAAIDAEPPLEDVLLSSGLVSEGLPGYDVAIAHDDGEWYASQQQVTMNESWPTGIVGTGPTINAAIHDAVEKAKEAT